MKSTSLLVLFTVSALALPGCDEVEEMDREVLILRHFEELANQQVFEL